MPVAARTKLPNRQGGTVVKKLSRSLAKKTFTPHYVDVVPISVLADKLRIEFAALTSRSGSALRAVDDQTLNEITSVCARVLASVNPIKEDGLVDPVSGLPLPPAPPEVLYKDRKQHPDLRKLNPEEFIDRTSWHKYKVAGLLAADFIRLLDPSLYAALNKRASYRQMTITDLMGNIGVIGRYTLDSPPDQETARVARLIRAAQAIHSIADSQAK